MDKPAETPKESHPNLSSVLSDQFVQLSHEKNPFNSLAAKLMKEPPHDSPVEQLLSNMWSGQSIYKSVLTPTEPKPQQPSSWKAPENLFEGMKAYKHEPKPEPYSPDGVERPLAPEGMYYSIDKNTGKVVLAAPDYRADYRPNGRDAWMERGYHYGIDPDTGKIEKIKHDITMPDFRTPSDRRGWRYVLDPQTGKVTAQGLNDMQEQIEIRPRRSIFEK